MQFSTCPPSTAFKASVYVLRSACRFLRKTLSSKTFSPTREGMFSSLSPVLPVRGMFVSIFTRASKHETATSHQATRAALQISVEHGRPGGACDVPRGGIGSRPVVCVRLIAGSDESAYGRSSLFRGRASLMGATLENLDETAVFGESSCNNSVAQSYTFGAVSPAPSSSGQSYIMGALSPTASSRKFTGQSAAVSVPVHDCSSYSSPAEMLSQDMEYPCIFAGMEGCEGKVPSLAWHTSFFVCRL